MDVTRNSERPQLDLAGWLVQMFLSKVFVSEADA